MDSTTSLLTVSDWRRAYRDGASPRALLDALRQRLKRDSPAEAWITLTGPAEIEASVAALEAGAARHANRAAALRAMQIGRASCRERV